MCNPEDLRAWITAISAPRLGGYRRFFQPVPDLELMGIYRWNEDVCAAFARNLAWVEIVLRNRFHTTFSQRYGTLGTAASRNWYDHLNLSAHSRESIRKIARSQRGRPRSPPPVPDDVIAKLTFGFWPALLDVNAVQPKRGIRTAAAS